MKKSTKLAESPVTEPLSYPTTPVFKPKNIPAELRRGLWLPWTLHQRRGAPKPSKVPMRQTGEAYGVPVTSFASTNAPEQWVTFAKALALHERCSRSAGLGRLCHEGDGLIIIDVDNISADPKTADAIIKALSTYYELSPSGNGLRLVLRGRKPDSWHGAEVGRIGKLRVEIFDESSTRFLTVTGNVGEKKAVAKADKKLIAWLEKHWSRSSDAAVNRGTPNVAKALIDTLNGELPTRFEPAVVDYTRNADDRSAAWGAACAAGLRANPQSPAAAYAAALAVMNGEPEKGDRSILVDGQRTRVSWAFYDFVRNLVRHTSAARQKAEADTAMRFFTGDLAALAKLAAELCERLPLAEWHIIHRAMKSGVSPRALRDAGVADHAIARVTNWLARRDERGA
ncbi:MAG: hypothetical protein FJX57_15990 [Alphaproteobacteria bacterium]|nr:hypothetical protein [Alphaproteobacteria bacterium]